MGVCFAASLLALSLGYSVALGAFIAGALVAESGQEKAVEHLVTPVRDLFVAIFFVAVGMLLDPMVLVEYWWMVLALVAIVIVGKVVAVSSGVFLTGEGLRPAVQAGMSLAQIGEFSFIIASVGLATDSIARVPLPDRGGRQRDHHADNTGAHHVGATRRGRVDAKLPGPLQTFVALYGSWLEGLRATPRSWWAKSSHASPGARDRDRHRPARGAVHRACRSSSRDSSELLERTVRLVPAGVPRRDHRGGGGPGGAAGGVSRPHDASPWPRDRRAGAADSGRTQGGHGSRATSRARGDAAVCDPVRGRRVAGGGHATVRAKHPRHAVVVLAAGMILVARRLAKREEPAGTRARRRRGDRGRPGATCG